MIFDDEYLIIFNWQGSLFFTLYIIRAELVSKEGDLFYKVSIAGQLDSELFPCGQILLKK